MARTFAQRVERAYLSLERRGTTRGARAWFARQARVRPYTVSRWVAANTDSPRALSILEQLETRAGLPIPTDAS